MKKPGEVTSTEKQRERRKWALALAAALLRSDMDCYRDNEDGAFDEDEMERRRAAVKQIADELDRKAKRMR